MKKSNRNGIVDFMRFVFCLVIVICHSRNLGGTPEIALFAECGYIGVEFFFLVSCFRMAQSAMRKQDTNCTALGVETVHFLWNKIKPILPFYSFAIICSYTRTIIANDFTLFEALENLMIGIWDAAFLRMSGIQTYSIVRATWYLSAMFLGMLILYPMLRKWKETFTHIIAPLIAIFFLGYLSQTYRNLDQYSGNYNLVYSGMLRALAELSLGCVCYVVYQKFQSVQLTTFSRVLVTLVQLLGYAGVIYCATDLPAKQFDFVMLLCLAVCVPLSFSGQGIAAPLFSHKIFPYLGKLSLVIYLNHMWIKDSIVIIFPKSLGYWRLLLICLLCVFLASFLCLLWGKGLHIFWNKFGSLIKGWFRKRETVE